MILSNLRLISSFLLGVFILMMVHDVVPHSHHFLDDSGVHAIHHHHHSDNSHKHNHDSEEKDNEGLLSLLFSFHVHSFDRVELIEWIRLERTIHVETFNTEYITQYSFSAFWLDDWTRIKKSPDDKIRAYDRYFSNCPDRGPPILG